MIASIQYRKIQKAAAKTFRRSNATNKGFKHTTKSQTALNFEKVAATASLGGLALAFISQSENEMRDEVVQQGLNHKYAAKHDYSLSSEQNYENCVSYVVDDYYKEDINSGKYQSYVSSLNKY